MSSQLVTTLSTLAASAVFAWLFCGRPPWQMPAQDQRGYRRIISFSAGMAVAYVFVHLLPEVGEASARVARVGEELRLPYADLRVYAAALVGFIVFYGLAQVRCSGLADTPEGAGEASERFHLKALTASYALYVFVVNYVMAHTMEAGGGRLALFALAMGLHFLGIRYGLRRDAPPLYEAWGKHLLAGSALAGWAMAVVLPLGEQAANLLLGFVAGAVIMNTVIVELPGEREGRFYAFVGGGALYTAVLLLIAA